MLAVKRDFPRALDLGSATDAVAQALARHPGIDTVFRAAPLAAAAGFGFPAVVADEEVLPFAQGALDLIVSGLSLQFVNDLPGALTQIRRALKPDGLLIAALIGGSSLGVVVRYASPFTLFADLRRMGAANALTERRRVPLRRATVLRAAELYAERFADADGKVRATFEIVWLSGWAPHESQQKPLRPGSARMRLADALGTQEVKTAGDIPPKP
ncbi:MAG: hypothetical protein B7Z45_05020 [Azorhizobium sp. 12-66-6]|nr:MAG: hypothetical protein B7Z45_05020 [Azorhizobium sp. 12-66-6]